MSNLKKINFRRIITIIAFVLFFSALASNFYHYYISKNYDYLLEASCDPSFEKCFSRDCELSPDDCPPNGLSDYKQFIIKAYDFPKCKDNSCKSECEEGTISCEEIMCGELEEDICTEIPEIQ